MKSSNLVLFVLCVALSAIDALDNHIHRRYRLVPTGPTTHHVRLHKRSLDDASKELPKRQVLIPIGNGQFRTTGLIDKLSDGIAQGLSKGLSAGISDGITGSVYALPAAIEGTLNNLKNPNYGATGGYAPAIVHGSQLSQYYPSGIQGYGNQLSQGIYGTHSIPYGSIVSPGFSQVSSGFSTRPSYLSHATSGSYSTGGSYSLPLSGSGISYTSPGYSHLSTGAGYAIPSYHSKPAPASPFHWDCKLIPAPSASYGSKLYKSASEDDMEDQVGSLSQLIQIAGEAKAINQDARSNSNNENSMETSNSNIEPMMAFYKPLGMTEPREMANMLREIEAKQNMAILEEMNMKLPPLEMVDASKLVHPHNMMGEPQGTPLGSSANVVLLLVPLKDNQNQQTYHQTMEHQHEIEHQQAMEHQHAMEHQQAMEQQQVMEHQQTMHHQQEMQHQHEMEHQHAMEQQQVMEHQEKMEHQQQLEHTQEGQNQQQENPKKKTEKVENMQSDEPSVECKTRASEQEMSENENLIQENEELTDKK